MGIYITLEIIPHLITPEDWAEVYHESLKLLEAYPGGIMGYKEEQVDSDVALVNGRDADREGKSVHVFGEKTQGEPYHIPLLAVASLIESRFTPYAIAGGDIDIGQAKKAVGWANTILERKIDLPVRVQPELLYERTEKCFKGKRYKMLHK